MLMFDRTESTFLFAGRLFRVLLLMKLPGRDSAEGGIIFRKELFHADTVVHGSNDEPTQES